MCTNVILRRPDHDWPIIMAALRDEMIDRPWLPPRRHWPDREEVTAGLDELAGGSWMGLNDFGVVACILNRTGHLGPATGKRSRGELVLEALDHADAVDSATALAQLDPDAYRPFNMIVADNRDAYWLRHSGTEAVGRVEIIEIPEGISMLTAMELNDQRAPRIATYGPRFTNAAPPAPESGDWDAWIALLAERTEPDDLEPNRAMTVVTGHGYGTVSASLLALPAPDVGKPVWLFAPGCPGETPFDPVPGIE
ncbi:MAG: NRDE family protein [Alphaproteobacteria bacterium]|jgi:hypothetical protein|nr:NRDE family protein [Alphaproteobacteria bacterium]